MLCLKFVVFSIDMKHGRLVTSRESHHEAKRKAAEAGMFLQQFIETVIRMAVPEKVKREHERLQRKAG